MNDSIISTENRISEIKREVIELERILLSQYTDACSFKGVRKGSRVTVQVWGKDELGIFDSCIFRYGKVRPLVMKIKKDGSAHASHEVYTSGFEVIKELQ